MGQVQSRQHDESYFKLESSDKAALEKKYIGESKSYIPQFKFSGYLCCGKATSSSRWRGHIHSSIRNPGHVIAARCSTKKMKGEQRVEISFRGSLISDVLSKWE